VNLKERLISIRKANPQLFQKLETNYNCITAEDVDPLTSIDRFMPCLVITNMGRFTTAVQNVTHYVNMIRQHAILLEKQWDLANCFTEIDKPKIFGDWVRRVELAAQPGD